MLPYISLKSPTLSPSMTTGVSGAEVGPHTDPSEPYWRVAQSKIASSQSQSMWSHSIRLGSWYDRKASNDGTNIWSVLLTMKANDIL